MNNRGFLCCPCWDAESPPWGPSLPNLDDSHGRLIDYIHISSAQQDRKVSGSRSPVALIGALKPSAEASSSDPVAVSDGRCNWLHLAELIKDREQLLCYLSWA